MLLLTAPTLQMEGYLRALEVIIPAPHHTGGPSWSAVILTLLTRPLNSLPLYISTVVSPLCGLTPQFLSLDPDSDPMSWLKALLLHEDFPDCRDMWGFPLLVSSQLGAVLPRLPSFLDKSLVISRLQLLPL